VSRVLELSAVRKEYGGLRPLRIHALALEEGEHVALAGVDGPAAEVLVNLVTGAVLPDEGTVAVFGRSTAAIRDAADWLATLDRLGIVSGRAVLLDQLSVLQNLAVPFSLDLEPPPADVRRRAALLAEEVGLGRALDRPVRELRGEELVRVRLGRAIALDPSLLVLEHPTAAVDRSRLAPLAREIRRVADDRGLAVLALTADREFARQVASRVLLLDAASGRLTARGAGWFRRS
jgi:peptide/nickel transport system ATP-binding protein